MNSFCHVSLNRKTQYITAAVFDKHTGYDAIGRQIMFSKALL
jgi:hypothetical protein